VTADDVRRVAQTYLTDANRSVIIRRPVAAHGKDAGAKPAKH
jgi:predicted Zn-dependent peptidase